MMVRTSGPDQTRRAIVRRVVQVASYCVLVGLLLFVSAGRADWTWGWIYLTLLVLLVVAAALVVPGEVIAERAREQQGVKRWDRVVTTLAMLAGLAVFVTAGLDFRFGWSAPVAALHAAGATMFVGGQALFAWAMASNRFFSTLVCLQFERDHSVACGGPYRIVRHPGYAGYIVSAMGTPLLLGSCWAIIPAAVSAGLFIVRTAFEDRTLRIELPGYTDFARQVRFRLLPGVW